MSERRTLHLDSARQNLIDAKIAAEKSEESNLEYFIGEARLAMEGYPEELPYGEQYRRALNNKNVKQAFEELCNIAGYLEEYDPEEDNYTFNYPYEALDRVEDAFRQTYQDSS